MTTQDAIIYLADAIAAQNLAIRSTADAVSALRDTLLFHHPEMSDDYAVRLDAAEKAHQQQTEQTQTQIAELRKVISQL